MNQKQVTRVDEAQSIEKANYLLSEGWKLFRTFSHPQTGYIMIFVKYELL